MSSENDNSTDGWIVSSEFSLIFVAVCVHPPRKVMDKKSNIAKKRFIHTSSQPAF